MFQVISNRYDKQGAIILTSNKAFAEWGDIFAGDAVMAAAALDRLLHRCTVINIRGESYRLKEKRQAAKSAGVNAGGRKHRCSFMSRRRGFSGGSIYKRYLARWVSSSRVLPGQF